LPGTSIHEVVAGALEHAIRQRIQRLPQTARVDARDIARILQYSSHPIQMLHDGKEGPVTRFVAVGQWDLGGVLG
jgi:hypothetical protein